MQPVPTHSFHDAKPYVRWWWLKDPFRKRDITNQLEWIKQKGFGGVEIAWMEPAWSNTPRFSSPAFFASALEQAIYYDIRVPQALTLLGQQNTKECPLRACSDRKCFALFQENTAWKCSSCQKRGDVIDLVAAVQGASREEAAIWLQRRGNLDLSDIPVGDLGWLTPQFSEFITYAKVAAEKIGLGCDFTFGSVWPFALSSLPLAHQSQTLFGPSSQQVEHTWETMPVPVLNHLSKEALDFYAKALAPSFLPALQGQSSSLFCDSLEIEKQHLWNPDLWNRFETQFGYKLQDILLSTTISPHIRYDYRKLIAKTMLENFYQHFSSHCHELGATSRVQCHGAPVDLISAYAAADFPESEALLFDPSFSRIAASAATLSKRSVVSCESFTCIYGFPNKHHKQEKIADLKFLADALFANGINQIIWHGMPYRPQGEAFDFFASVHVGPDAPFDSELTAFNAYLTTVSSYMRSGCTLSGLALYLPNEDMMMRGELPEELKIPAASDHWEMRHVLPPKEVEGYLPTWISGTFLERCKVVDGMLEHKGQTFPALYIDVEWLDKDALKELVRLASSGLTLIIKQEPKEPGHIPSLDYAKTLEALYRLPTVHPSLTAAKIRPILEGNDLPYVWARIEKETLYFFFSHPETRHIHYPMTYGQAATATPTTRQLQLNTPHGRFAINLAFGQNQSILLKVSPRGASLETLSF